MDAQIIMRKSAVLFNRCLTVLILATCLMSTALYAQTTRTWDGGGTTDNWSDGDNWVGGTAPTPSAPLNEGDPLVFTGTTRLDTQMDYAAFSMFGLILFEANAGAFVINGSNIIQGMGITVEDGAGPIAIHVPYRRRSGGGDITVEGSSQLTMTGTLEGWGTTNSYTKFGSGTLTLSGLNEYTQQTFIHEGTVRANTLANFGQASSLGTADRNDNEQAIVLGHTTTSGTLEYFGTGSSSNRWFEIGSGTGAATTGGGSILANGTGALVLTGEEFNKTVGSAAAGRTLTLGGSNTDLNTIEGVIQNNDSDREIRLAKTGEGVWVLGGDNTYSGTTVISEGTLLINGDQSAATGAVTVASGAVLGGSGIIGGATTISGSLRPGNSIGTLTIEDNVTWNAGDAWVFELGAAGAAQGSPGTSDLLAVGGDFIKGTGSSFEFDFAGSGSEGWYQLVSWTGSGATFDAGDFQALNLTPGFEATFFVEGDGLYISVIPEPSATLVLLGAFAATLLRRAPVRSITRH